MIDNMWIEEAREIGREDSQKLKYIRHAMNYGMSMWRLFDFLQIPHPNEIARWEDEGGFPR